MSQTKYITSRGLAFSENKDMEKLRRYSLKGWHVNDFKFMGYTLERGERSDYIYSIDYRWLQEDEKEEYIDFFASAGWSYVSSKGFIHLFRAQPGTKPIYTDRDTTVEKYEFSSTVMKTLAIPLVLMTALFWAGALISSDTLQTVLVVIAAILSVIAIPAAWTAFTTLRNKWKAEGRKRLANIGAIIPFLPLLIAVIALLSIRGTDTTVNIVTSGLIGAIVLPTAIWAIMSLFHKIRK